MRRGIGGVVLFEARPPTVRPGQPALLVWQTENPSGVSIEPEVGAVTPRGSKQVTPKATTRYTLTMKGGPTRTVTVTVEGTTPALPGAPTASVSRVGFRRMPDGTPDLSGVYGNAGLPQGTTPPALKPGAERFRIVRGGPNDADDRQRLQAAWHSTNLHHAVPISDRADPELDGHRL